MHLSLVLFYLYFVCPDVSLIIVRCLPYRSSFTLAEFPSGFSDDNNDDDDVDE